MPRSRLVPLLLAGAVLAPTACAGDDDPSPPPEGLLAEARPPASVAVPGADNDVPGTGADAVEADPSSTPPTVVAGSGSAPAGGPADPVADDLITPLPDPGRYAYRDPFDEDGGDEPAETLTVVGDGPVRFFDRRRGSELVRQEVTVVDGALVVTREQRTDGSATGRECPWSNALVVVPADRSAGVTWTSEGSCSTTLDVGTVTRTRRIEGSVTGPETVAVDGVDRPGTRMVRLIETSTEGAGVDVVERVREDVVWLPDAAVDATVDAEQLFVVDGVDEGAAAYRRELVTTDPA